MIPLINFESINFNFKKTYKTINSSYRLKKPKINVKSERQRKRIPIGKRETTSLNKRNINEDKLNKLFRDLNKHAQDNSISGIRFNVTGLKSQPNMSQQPSHFKTDYDGVCEINENIHLPKRQGNIYLVHLPIVSYYSFLLEAMHTSQNADNPLEFLKKMISVYDTGDHDDAANDDLKSLSRVFYDLLDKFVKSWIVKMNHSAKSIKHSRNLVAHDNCFSLAHRSMQNISALKELRKNLTSEEQKIFDQVHQKDDCVLWNIHRPREEKLIKYCCILNEKDLLMVIHEFRKICKNIIELSYEKESKTSVAYKINHHLLAQLKTIFIMILILEMM